MNRIYAKATIACQHYVAVVDGATNSRIATIPTLGYGCSFDDPVGIAVNPTTNRVYVTEPFAGTLTVIDGAANAIVDTIAFGSFPFVFDVAVNPVTNRIYVAQGGAIHVVDGATDAVTTPIGFGHVVRALAVNPTTNRLYVVVR
jgi:DNA-binding beta-propeller fold protein YncE